jgi:hypothetical protein
MRPRESITSSLRRPADADAQRMQWFEAGDHARVLETMPEFYRFRPEARFGHYLMMIGALGEGDCTATGGATGSTRTHRHRSGSLLVRPARRRLSQAAAYAGGYRLPTAGRRSGPASGWLTPPSTSKENYAAP